MLMAFNPESKAHAIRIMQNISQRPCAKPFLFPVDPIATNCLDYYKIIKKPISISVIINKLLNAEVDYPKIENWRSDILLLYENAITYHGKGTPISALADAFLKIFEKKFRSFSIRYDSSLWLKSFSSLFQKEKMLELHMPGTLGGVYRSLFNPQALRPPKSLSMPKTAVFKDMENNDKANAQNLFENHANQYSEEAPKPKKLGRPKKNTTLDPTQKSKEKTEKTPKKVKPRKPKQVEKKDLLTDQPENNKPIFPLKLNPNEIDPSLIDDIQQSYSPLEKTILIPNYPEHEHEQIDKNSMSTDISPVSFITYGITSNIKTINEANDTYHVSNPDLNTQNIKEDHFANSIFHKSAFNIEGKVPQPFTAKILHNDNMISPPEKCGRIGLPAKLEEKVEDMEDDVLFEVTSCFN